MRFHLVYSGALPAAGNKPKPEDVLRIRLALHPQLRHLWKTHSALQVLATEGARDLTGGAHAWMQEGPGGQRYSPRFLAEQFPDRFEDCCAPLAVGGREYVPLVRKSLDLMCELQILFLRQEDAGALVLQGGDLDNRIKTLMDALRVPTKEEQERCPPPPEAPPKLRCLMESDALVSRLDVDTDRLLFPQTDRPHEVHLVVEVTVNVLRVGPHNMCLL
jgi:hypothetical protein